MTSIVRLVVQLSDMVLSSNDKCLWTDVVSSQCMFLSLVLEFVEGSGSVLNFASLPRIVYSCSEYLVYASRNFPDEQEL